MSGRFKAHLLNLVTYLPPGAFLRPDDQGVGMAFKSPFSKFIFLVILMSKNKDAIAFLHDANARNDLKIAPLRQKFGLEGYGAFFMIVEILREQANFKIELSDLEGLSCQLQPHSLEFNKFLEFCFEKGLFKKDKKYMWSNSLLRRMESFNSARQRMSQGGKKGMARRYKHLISTLQVPCKVNQTKIKENKLNQINLNQIEEEAKKIIEKLNEVTGCHYNDLNLIIQNLLEGKTFKEHIHIIEVKSHDPHFQENPQFMAPATLFGKRFDTYKNQSVGMFKRKSTGIPPAPEDEGPPKSDPIARKKWMDERTRQALEER